MTILAMDSHQVHQGSLVFCLYIQSKNLNVENIKTIFFFSGLSTKGYKACPPCGDWLRSKYSQSLSKNIYLCHQQFLPSEHVLRSKANARHFNGRVENGRCPMRMTPRDWYVKWTNRPLIDPESEVTSDNDDELRPSSRGGKKSMAQHCSIWYMLEYWKDLKITHLLDPMHIFKNVAHSLWNHLVGFKDTEAARTDLKICNCKPSLWPIVNDETGKITYSQAPWVLTRQEISIINEWIRSIRTPTGYGASLQNMFTMDDNSLSGLKTHDWHNFIKV